MKYNKISDVISSQVPAFFNDEYPNLILFLQAYYRFLETQQINRNIESFRDIDTTLDQFVESLKGELASSSPYYENIKAYLPHLKQHFASKGSEESYTLLFRLLYNKDVDIAYPGSSVMRLSEGKWNQEKSIQIQVSSGDVQSINNKFILVKTANNNIKFHVKQVNTLDVVNGLYELFLDKNYLNNISIGDTITYDGFTATVVPSITKVTITDGGLNYKVGDFYPITATGTGASVKIKKVNSLGTILEVELIEFGKGYTSNFETSLSTSSYFDDIEPDLLLENGNSLAAEQQTDAILFFDIGTISTYPGYYLTEENFVSGLSYIQDGDFYQDYSYVVSVDERLDSYKQYILDFVHPVGKKLFGKYTIQNDFELLAEIALSILKFQFPEVVTTDDYALFVCSKLLNDDQLIVDSSTFALTKAPFNDNTGASTDSKKLATRKTLADATSTATETNIFDVHSTLFDTTGVTTDTTVSDIHSTLFDSLDSPIDSAIIGAYKAVVDATGVTTDTTVSDIHSTLFDATASTTDTTVSDIHSTLFDATNTATDADIFDVHKTATDATDTTTDADILDVRKTLVDATSTSTETNIFDVHSTLFDATSTSTEANVFNVHSTLFDATSTSTETNVFNVHSTLFDATSTSTETNIFDVHSTLFDATSTSTETIASYVYRTLIDSVTPNDDIIKSFSTSVSDASTIDDVIASIGKLIADSVINTDSGIIQVNPYDVTGDYFAEVYQSGRSTF